MNLRVISLLSLVLGVFLLTPQPLFAGLSQKIGVVGAVNPDLLAKHKETKARKPLVLGNAVFFEDTIITDKNGTAQILFIDKSALTIGPNSHIVIDKYVYNPATSTGELVINAAKGTLRFVGGALSKKNPVKIKTPEATIGIRGGIGMVNVKPGRPTNAVFIYGHEMTLKNVAGVTTLKTPGTSSSVHSYYSPPAPPMALKPVHLNRINRNLESQTGQNGGVTEVPKADEIEEKIINVVIEEEAPAQEEQTEKQEQKEKKKAKTKDAKQEEKTAQKEEAATQEEETASKEPAEPTQEEQTTETSEPEPTEPESQEIAKEEEQEPTKRAEEKPAQKETVASKEEASARNEETTVAVKEGPAPAVEEAPAETVAENPLLKKK
jgi:hypothetical protein